MKQLKLEVLTPQRLVYQGMVEMVSTMAPHGDIGILPGRLPFASPLGVTTLRITAFGQQEQVTVHQGLLDVGPEQMTVFAEQAERANEINYDRAAQAKERASCHLEQPNKGTNITRAQYALAKALNRLRTRE
ncbi:MAG: synthase epsilon chain [Bacillota bacterium]